MKISGEIDQALKLAGFNRRERREYFKKRKQEAKLEFRHRHH